MFGLVILLMGACSGDDEVEDTSMDSLVSGDTSQPATPVGATGFSDTGPDDTGVISLPVAPEERERSVDPVDPPDAAAK